MAKKASKDAKQETVNTVVKLSMANRKYLFARKGEGKGSVSEQVNKLIEMVRVAGWE